ncbi:MULTISPECIES: DUF1883 domain-containing protein [unclassified Pseudomonas]|uniref:DUF1883 domain-containing protein n=1 Tax=unclassified Pseudomonas TaxID=196821 RepID=UPI000A1DFFEC|nr:MULTISPECIES: DUF1883 domain-containing protein [unclassified Pseudomonas]
MDFLHKREHLTEGDIVEVDCSHQCNIQLTSDADFARYKEGLSYSYLGGFYKMLPAQITAPRTGYWNITIDLGNRSAMIKHSIRIIRQI